MTRFVTNQFAQFTGSTNISAGHCHMKQNVGCVSSLPARPGGNRRTTDTTCRSLVPRPGMFSRSSGHTASDLVLLSQAVCSGSKQHAPSSDPMQKIHFADDL